MASSLWLLVFNVCLVFICLNVVLTKSDLLNRVRNENPLVELSVYPNAGISTENIQVRCQIAQSSSSSISPISKLDNVFLSIKTDNVKPSGIFLMFDDSKDQCQINRENIHIDICNASLILIRINHTILNETLQKIDYSCSKGTTYAYSSYRIIKDQSARYYDPTYNSSSSSLIQSYFLLLFICCLTQMIEQITTRIR